MNLKILLEKHPKKIKCGQLKYLNLECPDVDQFFLRKAARSFNRCFKNFILSYFPSLKGFDILFITEDVSPHQRELVKRAEAAGLTTVVVQHGLPGHAHGFVPLTADYFLSWPESKETFIQWGMPEERIIIFEPQRPTRLNYIAGIEAVLFLHPPLKTYHYQSNPIVKTYSEEELIQIIREVSRKEPSLWVKPHLKFYELWKDKLSHFKLTFQQAYDLIFSAKRVYCFDSCTIKKDVEVMGKTPIIVG